MHDIVTPQVASDSAVPWPRRRTQAVNIGHVTVGGGHPVVVQSMTNTDTADVVASTKQ
ncbi:MAG TPA: flavodoxin-dependent (E)-4-hydroxy-3-methylbut-2-enyl-diphosphate synthase, partial [Xylella fastidiosa subsp. pauca]